MTGAQLGQLQLAKQAAVASEDYDEAKRLKSTIDRCGMGCFSSMHFRPSHCTGCSRKGGGGNGSYLCQQGCVAHQDYTALVPLGRLQGDYDIFQI